MDVQKARLEFEKACMTSAIEMGDLIAVKCYPSSDAEAKATLSRTLLRNLIQFGLSKAVELTLLPPQAIQEEAQTDGD